MPNKMLIDASHPEETRVVVLRGNRVEEFDFESASKKQLRGNIYLAKVTRVEPSLQAAFVDYGGNRHGFLAFSEIHPDYYQIPIADRQALLEEDARAQRAEDESEARGASRRRRRRSHGGAESREKRSADRDETVSEHFGDESVAEAGAADDAETGEPVSESEFEFAPVEHDTPDSNDPHEIETEAEQAAPSDEQATLADIVPEPAVAPVPPEHETVEADAHAAATDESALPSTPEHAEPTAEATDAAALELHDAPEVTGDEAGTVEALREADPGDEGDGDSDDEEDDDGEEGEPAPVEQIGGDALEEIPHRPLRPRRQYKIQEVIKRRQVLLVQVAKEERGTEGAALTTYLSLAGRYSVLMPNTARGGGISRKITNALDRKRLKAIAEDLEVPEGMGIILRTAGASRTKAEVKRDFEYLLRMWETVREVTLKSTAPTLVYEEGSLIKRAIRDLYNKDIDEVVVAGEEGYREAKEFMRMLMPSHAKNVKLYKDVQPMFARAGAEAQLDAMFTNQVTLRSGGYIVINQTEALVAIDVNSGRSTREHNIEDTALRTNLEAADEVARQLRLRDLAGLIVVDFIDMEESRNNRSVERRMKDALKNDRARIQIGRIPHFGLLEMSRQRIRTGVLEGSTVLCPHCMGAGMIRSTSSIALHVLRGLEDALIKSAQFNVNVRARSEVALYVLNHKRSHLRELETRFGVAITVTADAALTGVVYFAIERGEPATPLPDVRRSQDLVRVDSVQPVYEDEEDEEIAGADEAEAEAEAEDEALPVESDGDSDEAEEHEHGDRQARDGGDDRGGDGDAGRRRRRRRRRRGRDRDGRILVSPNGAQPSDAGLAIVGEIAGDVPASAHDTESPSAEPLAASELDGDEAAPKRVREDRRHGRRPRRDDAYREAGSREAAPPTSAVELPSAAIPTHPEGLPEAALSVDTAPEAGHEPFRSAHDDVAIAQPPVSRAADETASTEIAPLSVDGSDVSAAPAEAEPEDGKAEASPVVSAAPEASNDAEEPRPKRSGWWQRAKASLGG